MSFTYNKNKSRPNADPCGTWQVRFLGSKNVLPILTLRPFLGVFYELMC